MEEFYKSEIIKDEKKRKGALLKKQNVYNKAWFHHELVRWDPSKYGEKGQNFQEWVFNDKEIKFVDIVLLRDRYRLEMSDFRKFYIENPNVKDVIFGEKRYLFPIKLCQKIN